MQRDVIKIELHTGESIRMTITEDTARGELIRDGAIVASARFGDDVALRSWADAMMARAIRIGRPANCINCDD